MNFASHGVINVGTAVTLAAPFGHSPLLYLLLRPAGIIPFTLLQLTAVTAIVHTYFLEATREQAQP